MSIKAHFVTKCSYLKQVLHVLGGAVGVRKTVHNILQKMSNVEDSNDTPEIVLVLRGDSVECLTQIAQSNTIMRLEKALKIAINHSKPTDTHEYPEISLDDMTYDIYIYVMLDTELGVFTSLLSVPSETHDHFGMSLEDIAYTNKSPQIWNGN